MIVREVLVLLQALLESGNSNVQSGFLELKASPGSVLFPTLQSMLSRGAVVYSERYEKGLLPSSSIHAVSLA